jgi:hypothetical protein
MALIDITVNNYYITQSIQNFNFNKKQTIPVYTPISVL